MILMKSSEKTSILHKDGVSFVLPFILITSCFALWGFANDITNPMVKAFSKIFRMSVTDGALVQVAFYGGYFAMAFPAAIFIRRYSYKAGILLGLGLYAIGAFLFFPAKVIGEYGYFLLAYFILTCGLSFLETSANPYILSMGTEETATRRLNLAQSFNPMGSLLGMYVAMNFIQAKLNPMDSEARALLDDAEFNALKDADLSTLIAPYLAIGVVIAVMFCIILFAKMPKNGDQSHDIRFGATMKRLIHLPRYREGVIAQFFYNGGQTAINSLFLVYSCVYAGLDESTATTFFGLYMLAFLVGRWVGTALMVKFSPHRMLLFYSIMLIILCVVICVFGGYVGLYAMLAVSFFMSIIYPTQFSLALQGLGDQTKSGSAFLVMAIVGNACLPQFTAYVMHVNEHIYHIAYIVPMVCFAFCAYYGWRGYKVK